jgi:hypothetical protein
MILGQIKPLSDMKSIIPTTQDFMWLQVGFEWQTHLNLISPVIYFLFIIFIF